jgi:hypothetical protein
MLITAYACDVAAEFAQASCTQASSEVTIPPIDWRKLVETGQNPGFSYFCIPPPFFIVLWDIY